MSIKKGKRYCQHSKGIAESAIEKAILESFRLLYQNNEAILEMLLQVIEEKLEDDSAEKELRRLEKELVKLKNQEREVFQMKFDGRIGDDLYDEKFYAIMKEQAILEDEKLNIEVSLRSDSGVKERLESFRDDLTSKQLITEFDRSVFESLVEKVIVGGITEDGTIDPAKICFVYKSGNESSFNGKQFKDRRKNTSSKQASETTELCSIDRNNDKKLYTQQVDTKD